LMLAARITLQGGVEARRIGKEGKSDMGKDRQIRVRFLPSEWL